MDDIQCYKCGEKYGIMWQISDDIYLCTEHHKEYETNLEKKNNSKQSDFEFHQMMTILNKR